MSVSALSSDLTAPTFSCDVETLGRGRPLGPQVVRGVPLLAGGAPLEHRLAAHAVKMD